jgi:hypothetical protein
MNYSSALASNSIPDWSLFSDILKEMDEILFMTHHVKNASLSY